MWEHAVVTRHSNDLNGLKWELNRMGLLGWEAVGVTNNDPTVGLNSMTVVMKRWVDPWPAPSVVEAAWHPDPTGRADHRWWDGKRWTESVVRGGKNETDFPHR